MGIFRKPARERFAVMTERKTAHMISFLLLVAVMAGAASAQTLTERWVFSSGYGRTRADVDRIKALVDTAAAHGLNGLVLSSFGLDEVWRWEEADTAYLEEILSHCSNRKIELIPIGFSAGYGGGALRYDRNFAAALPVTFGLVAEGGKVIQVLTEGNLVRNGGLERYHGDRFDDFTFHDQPGEVSFVDTQFFFSGNASIRMENFSASEHGLARIMQEVEVKPGCSYRFSVRTRTRDVQPVSGVRLLVLDQEGATIMIKPADVRPTQGWTETSAEFTSYSEKKIRVYAGVWRGTSGTLWLDDLELRQVGSISGIVCREGTPIELSSRDRDMVFVEGTDFMPVKNLPDLDHIELTADTRIGEGEQLALSCFRIPFINKARSRQTSLCMSNPDLYRYWEAQARALYELTGFKKFFLSMDEIRNGGGCELCRQSGRSMAQILGECITRQYGILKAIDPEIEVYIWSDMLDPGHNARDNYYGVVGDLTGSWEHVPEGLVIVCWHQEKKDSSLDFFSKRGFRTVGAAYYDADDLAGSQKWLEALRGTPGATGIIYTSWRKRYGLLADFGDMVSGTAVR